MEGDFVSIGEAAKSVLAELREKMKLNFELKQPEENDNQNQNKLSKTSGG